MDEDVGQRRLVNFGHRAEVERGHGPQVEQATFELPPRWCRRDGGEVAFAVLEKSVERERAGVANLCVGRVIQGERFEEFQRCQQSLRKQVTWRCQDRDGRVGGLSLPVDATEALDHAVERDEIADSGKSVDVEADFTGGSAQEVVAVAVAAAPLAEELHGRAAADFVALVAALGSGEREDTLAGDSRLAHRRADLRDFLWKVDEEDDRQAGCAQFDGGSGEGRDARLAEGFFRSLIGGLRRRFFIAFLGYFRFVGFDDLQRHQAQMLRGMQAAQEIVVVVPDTADEYVSARRRRGHFQHAKTRPADGGR